MLMLMLMLLLLLLFAFCLLKCVYLYLAANISIYLLVRPLLWGRLLDCCSAGDANNNFVYIQYFNQTS